MKRKGTYLTFPNNFTSRALASQPYTSSSLTLVLPILKTSRCFQRTLVAEAMSRSVFLISVPKFEGF